MAHRRSMGRTGDGTRREAPASAGEDDRASAALVVAIGASAGGLDALRRFFAGIPADTGLTFVVLYHADPSQPSLLADLLASATRIPVVRIGEGLALRPDCIHVMMPGTLLDLHGGVLTVAEASQEHDARHPVDFFFTALARDQGTRAVGIVLSGTGNDGSAGVRALRQAGGWSLAEAPATAKFDGMPASAIATGCVDESAPVEALPALLLQHARADRLSAPVRSTAQDTAIAARLPEICTTLHRVTGHDFARYKRNTLVRRVQHRMRVLRLDDVAAYVLKLQDDAQEPERLLQDLLIGVTQFFRDPEAFAAVERQVLAPLFAEPLADRDVRVWVPGCATGEEAYSLAILLAEQVAATAVPPRRVTIFATDIDRESLDVARRGRYPLTAADDIGPERLDKWFERDGDAWQIRRSVRDLCTFSLHNLVQDPPFARLDLVSCRNLLIYIDHGLQEQVNALFHYALRPGGWLLLGQSEQASEALFRVQDKKARLFQRRDVGIRPLLAFPLRPAVTADKASRPPLPLALAGPDAADANLIRSIERILLSQYAPASVLVTDRSEVVYASGPINQYLEFQTGVPTLDLFQLARNDLRPELRAVVRQSAATPGAALSPELSIPWTDARECLRIEARRLHELGSGDLTLVVFRPCPLPPPALQLPAGEGGQTAVDPEVARLRFELDSTQEHLRAAVAEVEHANQDLRQSNEELLSLNEELQSANEELQTAKEEMQSVNEELETVNAELTVKLDELGITHADLENLFRATEIATLFLDRELTIQRFTPAARALFRLIDGDVRRPIVDIVARFPIHGLDQDFATVLATRRPVDREVVTDDAKHTYLLRILPYHTVDGRVDGLVLTFVDVSELKRGQAAAALLAAIVQSSHDAIFSLSPEGLVTSWNAGAEAVYGYEAAEIVGHPASRLTTADTPGALDVPEEVAAGRSIRPRQAWQRRKDGRSFQAQLTLSPVRDAQGTVVGMAVIARDLTEPLAVEAERQRLYDELLQARKMEALGVLAGGIAHDFNNMLTAILGFAELSAEGATDPDLRANLDEIVATGRKAAELTRRLLGFARRQPVAPEVIDVHAGVQGAERLVRSLLGPHVDLQAPAPAERAFVRIDPQLFEQALVNLALNARDAMPDGGRLRILQSVVDLRESEGIADLAPGRYAQLRVQDDGVGMDSEQLAHCFEPFYTTKTRGSGTGLGLATAFGTVTQAGGHIDAQSRPGKGTTIRILLPAVPEPPPDLPAPRPEAAPAQGSETVLLVDDTGEVLRLARDALTAYGYRVLAAEDGTKALTLARKHPDFAVLVTDVLMPKMSGLDLARRLTDQRPDLRVLFISGYTEDLLGSSDIDRPGRAFLAKPFSPRALAQAVRALLDAPKT